MISLKKFIEKYKNTFVDVPWANGALKGQCVSLVQIYLNECYGIPLKARGNGNQYCQSIVNSGLGYYVDEPKRGDIINYDTIGDSNPYGHIAIVVNENQVFEQCVEYAAHYGSIYQNQHTLHVVRLYGNRPEDEDKNWGSLSDKEIAHEIMYGNNIWGNGDIRKNNLGYRYENIQKIIDAEFSKKQPAKELKVGNKIRIKKGSKDTNRNIIFADWVYNSEFIVMNFDSNGNVGFGNGVYFTGEVAKENVINI